MSATVLSIAPARAGMPHKGHLGFIVAWGFCLLFYFGQYALRSAPGVTVPELTAFGLAALGIGSLLGLYCYTFAIVAGASLDRFGVRCVFRTAPCVWPATDVVNRVLVGADAAMTTSAILHGGIDTMTNPADGLRRWMQKRAFTSLDAMQGILSWQRSKHQSACTRANDLRTLKRYWAA